MTLTLLQNIVKGITFKELPNIKEDFFIRFDILNTFYLGFYLFSPKNQLFPPIQRIKPQKMIFLKKTPLNFINQGRLDTMIQKYPYKLNFFPYPPKTLPLTSPRMEEEECCKIISL